MNNNIEIFRKDNHELIEKLQKIVTFFRSFSSSASICSKQFHWLAIDSTQMPLPLLDFDVICGALKPFGIKSLVQKVSEDIIEFNYETLGTNVLKYVLESMQNYTLPVGTKIELLEKKKNISKKLSSHANFLLKKFKQARKENNPVKYIKENFGSQELDDTIINEFNMLSHEWENYSFLNTLFTNCVPIEEFMGAEPEDNQDIYSKTIKYLSSVRPNLTRNNFNDALNIALLVWIYISPQMLEGWRPVPILISQTTQVLKLESIIKNAIDLHNNDDLQILSDVNYFIISQLISERMGGRSQLIADNAYLLSKRTEEIAHSFNEIINILKKNNSNGSMINSIQWEIANTSLKKFFMDWDWLLNPLYNAKLNDRIDFLNQLFGGELTKILYLFTTNRVDKVNEAIKKTIYLLHENIQTDVELEKLVYYSDSFLLNNNLGNKSLTEDLVFSQLNVEQDDGRLLSEIQPENEIINDSLSKKHLRIVVHSNSLIKLGAILVIDFWKDNFNTFQKIGFIWPHKMDAWSLSQRIISSIFKIDNINENNAINVKVFMTNGLHKKRKIKKQLDIDKIRKKLEIISEADYLEFSTENVLFFMDVLPIENHEYQVGFTMYVDKFINLVNYIKDIIKFSTNYSILGPIYYNFIDELMNKVSLIVDSKWKN